MKKLYLIFVLAFSINYGFAQLGEAKSNLTAGTLDRAKTAIDNALNEDKQKANPDAWYTKGEIYQEINKQVRSGIELYKSIVDNAIEESYLAYRMAIKLQDEKLEAKAKEKGKEKGKNKFLSQFSEKANDLAQLFLYEGGLYYKNEQFTKALNAFEFAVGIDSIKIKEEDAKPDTLTPTLYFYAGFCANLAKQPVKALKYYEAAQAKGYKENIKVNIIRATIDTGDTTKAITMLRNEITANPKEDLLIELVNILLKKKESAEAIKFLDMAIEKNPTNHSFYYAKGTLYDRQADPANAEKMYLKALEIKKDYMEALYNLGALYVNQANAIILDASKLPINESKKYDAMVNQSKDIFSKALPYLEQALSLSPNEKSLLQTVREIYLKKQMKDKAKEMQDRLEKL